MKQSDNFIEKRNKLKTVISFNSVFKNSQLRTKMYGQLCNGVRDVALTERERYMARIDIQEVKDIIQEFEVVLDSIEVFSPTVGRPKN